ncbi:MAG: amidase [Myxococcales bacterium]|nr:amidase [Myxococcales bacterium]HIK83620.1 amidase [Myxococcales bacterium]
MSELGTRSARDLAAMIRRKEISSRELLDYFLGAVAEKNTALNAVVTLDEESARKSADEADEAVARGDALGPLHGLPITIKDSFETAGLRTTAGAPEFKDHVPTRDADAVAKLRQAGAVVFGKTNLPFMAADVQSYNELFGCSNNPYDITRTPGGSSGGAAAAVAAGLTSFELGSDIGGSIRTPAHWNGIYGHKPTYGLVPDRGHVPGPPGSVGPTDLTVAGPLARSAEDLAMTFDVLAGADADNEIGWRLDLPKPRHQRLSDFRVAVWFDDPALPIDDSVRARFEATVEALRGAGVQVDEKARPDFALPDLIRVYYQLLMPIMLAGIPKAVLAGVEQAANSFAQDDFSDAAESARAPLIRHRDWVGKNEFRHKLRAVFHRFFADYDVLLCPVNPVPAIPHDHSSFAGRTIEINGQGRPYNDLFGWIAMATTCYLPATVAPIGPTPEGLPVGAQIVGPYLEDRTTIEFARLLGEVVGGFSPPTT